MKHPFETLRWEATEAALRNSQSRFHWTDADKNRIHRRVKDLDPRGEDESIHAIVEIILEETKAKPKPNGGAA